MDRSSCRVQLALRSRRHVERTSSCYHANSERRGSPSNFKTVLIYSKDHSFYEMAPVYFLVYCVFTSALVSGQSTRYELVGLEVNLKPDISEQPDQILWMHNGNKVVESDGKEEQVYGSYVGRVTLDWISAELRIRDLRYEDSGEYELEVFMNKNLLRSQFTVEVIDKVSIPTISCQMNDGSSSDTPELQATLMCSADSRRPQSLMKFEWISNGNVQPGPNLTIPLRSKQDDEVYSCRVRNPLTKETANFIAKDCYPDESSNVPLVAGLGAAFAVSFIVLVVLGILFCKQQHEACFAEREGSDGRTDLSDEMRPLFHTAPTYPSPQQLTQDERPLEGKVKDPKQFYESLKDHVVKRVMKFFKPTNAECTLPPNTPTDKNTDTNKETVSPPVSPVRKPSCGQDSNNLPSNDTGNKDAEPPKESTEETVPEPNSSDSDLQSQTASERPESVKADEDKESLPARGTSAPTAPLLSPLTQNSPNMESYTAGKPKEDTDSDQVTGEPAEESDRESDSSHLEKINGPHDSSEEKQSSTVLKRKDQK